MPRESACALGAREQLLEQRKRLRMAGNGGDGALHRLHRTDRVPQHLGEEPGGAQVQVRLMLRLHQLHPLVGRHLLVGDGEIAALLVANDGRVELVPDLRRVLALAEGHHEQIEHLSGVLDLGLQGLLRFRQLEGERADDASPWCG